jgi:hypothetical protein
MLRRLNRAEIHKVFPVRVFGEMRMTAMAEHLPPTLNFRVAAMRVDADTQPGEFRGA